jgi:spiro-SPASM protein
MNALMVLYGGGLNQAALEPVFSGKNALTLTLERASRFPGVTKTIFLGRENFAPSGFLPPQSDRFVFLTAPVWTTKGLLETMAAFSVGFDLSYYAWADCPFLDPDLAGAVAERHLRYAAEYSYADGWPYGFAPELLSPGTAGILAKILGDDQTGVERDALFSVIRKDINAFDIETEISPADLRSYRLSLSADSKRNLLLLTRFFEAGLSGAGDAEGIISDKPGLLRTLPNFYPIQVSGPCPQSCAFCPYPHYGGSRDVPVTERKDFLPAEKFEELLDKIAAFSGDAVIDLSLWGELSLHPQKTDLIAGVFSRPGLSLVIETSGIGWKAQELETIGLLAEQARRDLPRLNSMAPLSWIVSLDTLSQERYREIRGAGASEALECAKQLLRIFSQDAYVQALRTRGDEDDIERFYRFWKEAGASIIIQKYNNFCGLLPDRRASDLSPLQRQPCWHIMRDMPVLIDGRVPRCGEDLSALKGGEDSRILGNVFSESLETIWSRGEALYREQCIPEYSDICAECDEYYTYNF